MQELLIRAFTHRNIVPFTKTLSINLSTLTLVSNNNKKLRAENMMLITRRKNKDD
tara:strand:+ start:550 stop:714 length:165 start_codon:yes stop_codon:yes gene_type:complete